MQTEILTRVSSLTGNEDDCGQLNSLSKNRRNFISRDELRVYQKTHIFHHSSHRLMSHALIMKSGV